MIRLNIQNAGEELQYFMFAGLRGCLHGGRKVLALGRSEKAEKRFIGFTCRNFGPSGYQVEKE